MNSQGIYSPFNGSQGTASVASPMSTSSSFQGINLKKRMTFFYYSFI